VSFPINSRYLRGFIVEILDQPLFTDIYSNVEDFIPEQKAAYIFGTSVEERSNHLEYWKGRGHNLVLVPVVEINPTEISVEVNGNDTKVQLRSGEQLQRLMTSIGKDCIYLDITGISHHVWAPLLKVALQNCSNVIGVYVEPGDYRFSASPKEGEIFDLSERITGLSPIPGFLSLREPKEEVCFIPVLGFEGTRLSYLIEQVQPPGEKILPIIGVPGFRPEYPFFAYHGNQLPLTRSHAWRKVRYAIANCPFSLYYVLQDIASQYPDNFMKIAPIGTKPHALGAVLYKIVHNSDVELIYDHPIRKATRTKGTSRLLVYHISSFISPVCWS